MLIEQATGFFKLSALEIIDIVAERERQGWRIFRLPMAMSSKTDFFEGVRLTLPLDPPLQKNLSWDALADSLWAGLDGLSDNKVVIVWPEASTMQVRASDDFAIAINILADLLPLLANE